MPNAPDSPLSPDSWAEVRGRNHIVRYRRSGVGRTVLVLQPPGAAEPLQPELLQALGPGCRLILPNPPAAETALDSWLSVLLEGLGIANVTVVTSDDFCIAALEHALQEREQVSRAILMCRDEASAHSVVARLLGIPLLVLLRSHPPGEIGPLVAEFLASGHTSERP